MTSTKEREEVKNFFTEVCQLANVGRNAELANHHYTTPTE